MPPWLATIMQGSPSTHFVSFAQAILHRGAGIDVVWPQFFAVAGIDGLFLAFADPLPFRAQSRALLRDSRLGAVPAVFCSELLRP
jgi:hypothetical protein